MHGHSHYRSRPPKIVDDDASAAEETDPLS